MAMAARAFVSPATTGSSDFASLSSGHDHHLLQHFVRPFLHHLHLRTISRTNVVSKESLNRLQQDLVAYSGSPEGQQQEETRTAEQLVEALYSHRILLYNSEASAYAKILQKLWEFEDQGLISRSSLVNDLAVRALLEAHRRKSCRPAIASALQTMFITSSRENKGVLVDAILRAICIQSDLLNVWNRAIIGSIGKSAMRLNVVELALIERCTSDDLIINQKTDSLLCCIRVAASSSVFDCDKIRQAVCEQISYTRGQATLCYIRFFQALAEADNVDSMVYIDHLIKFLREKKGLDMAIQTAIYNAIDHLKQKSAENVYKAPYFEVFSEKWLLP